MSWVQRMNDGYIGGQWTNTDTGETVDREIFGHDPAVIPLLDKASAQLGLVNPDYLALAKGIIQRDNINGGSGFMLGSNAADIANLILREASFDPKHQAEFAKLSADQIGKIRDAGYAAGHGYFDPSGKIYQDLAAAGVGRDEQQRAEYAKADKSNRGFGSLQSMIGLGMGIYGGMGALNGLFGSGTGAGVFNTLGEGAYGATGLEGSSIFSGVDLTPLTSQGDVLQATLYDSGANQGFGLDVNPMSGATDGAGYGSSLPSGAEGVTGGGLTLSNAASGASLATAAAKAAGGGDSGDPDLRGVGTSAGSGWESLPGEAPYYSGGGGSYGLEDFFKQLMNDPKGALEALGKSGIGDNLKDMIGSYFAYNQSKDNQQQLIDAMKYAVDKSDPFASQRPFYQTELKNMYSDPEYWNKSPILTSMKKNAMDETNRSMAAQGYNMSGNQILGLGERLQNTQAQYAFPMIQQTAGQAGAGFGPGYAGITAQQGGQAAVNAGQQGNFALGNLFNSAWNAATGTRGSNGYTGIRI